MRADANVASTRARISPRRSIYSADGSNRLGDVQHQQDDDVFIARSRTGVIIGAYSNMDEAVAAIAKASAAA